MMMTVLLWGVLEATSKGNNQSMTTTTTQHAPQQSTSEFAQIG